MSNRVSPYVALRDSFREYLSKVRSPKSNNLWVYPKDAVLRRDSWKLDDLYHSVVAADRIGFDTVLTADGEGLIVRLRQRPGEPERSPW